MVLGAVPGAARSNREAAPPPPLSVTVRPGDSIWTIAREYGDPERDVREIVYAVIQANDADPGQLQAGSRLIIPAEYTAHRR
jgi:Tfp pilus assembly protein FimV